MGLLPQILTGSANSTIQDEKDATLAPKISAIDSLVDLTKLTSMEVHNRVLAYSEWPGTHCIIKFENDVQPPVKVKLLATAVIDAETEIKQPSSQEVKMAKCNSRHCMKLRCKDNTMLAVFDILPENRKPMDAKSFWNGLRGKKIFV